MAKPIFIVFAAKNIERERRTDIANMLTNKIDDYHCLVVSTDNNENEFKVFYEKDFNEVKFEELKRIVEDAIKKDT